MATLARFRWIVAATVLGLLAGFLVSYLFNPKYSSRARIEEFSDAGDRWTSFITPDSQTEFMVFQQRALSPNNLRPVIEREGVAKSEGAETVYGELVKNARFQLASSDDAAPYTEIDIDLIYTDSNPQRAEQLCNVLTSGVLDESKADSQRAIGDTTYILEQALKDAKNDVQDIHGRLLKRPSDRKLAREYAKAQERPMPILLQSAKKRQGLRFLLAALTVFRNESGCDYRVIFRRPPTFPIDHSVLLSDRQLVC